MVLWLHCTGTEILDSYNNPYHLKGCNTWLRIEDGVDFLESDVEQIASWGFNVIRAFIFTRHFISDVDTSIQATRFTNYSTLTGPALDDVMDWCEKYDVYFMPSMEILNYTNYRTPNWMHAQLTQEHATNRHYWFCALITNSSIAGQNYTNARLAIRNMFAAMAARYHDRPNLIFDLWNEPYITPYDQYGGLSNVYSGWTTYCNELIAAIRAAETTNHLITITSLIPRCYSPGCWSDVTGDDIVWCDHTYPFEGQNYNEPYPGDDYDTMLQKWYLDITESTTIARYGRPVMMSEIGRKTHPQQYGGDYDYTVDVFRGFDEVGVDNWNWWEISRRIPSGATHTIIDTSGVPLEIDDYPGHTFIEVIRENTYKSSVSSKIADAYAMLSE